MRCVDVDAHCVEAFSPGAPPPIHTTATQRPQAVRSQEQVGVDGSQVYRRHANAAVVALTQRLGGRTIPHSGG